MLQPTSVHMRPLATRCQTSKAVAKRCQQITSNIAGSVHITAFCLAWALQSRLCKGMPGLRHLCDPLRPPTDLCLKQLRSKVSGRPCQDSCGADPGRISPGHIPREWPKLTQPVRSWLWLDEILLLHMYPNTKNGCTTWSNIDKQGLEILHHSKKPGIQEAKKENPEATKLDCEEKTPRR